MFGRKDFIAELIGLSLIFLLIPFADIFAEPGWLKDAIDSTGTIVVDREAPAFIIHDEAETVISKNGKAKTHARRAVKILNSLGARYGILNIMVHSAQEVKNLKGWLIEDNGQKQNLGKDNIVKADLALAAGYYDDIYSLVAAFPDIEVGDVVAYEYDIIESEYWCSYIQSFMFQKDLPVYSPHYAVELPGGWEFNETGQYIDSVKRSAGDNRYEWQFGFLPYRPEESYMPEWAYQMRFIAISCYDPGNNKSYLFGDWKTVSDWVRELFEEAVVDDELLTAVTDSLKTSFASKEQQARAITEYVRDEIRYVAVEIGEGRYRPRNAPLTLSNRFGDCKDKATLLIAMLRDAGIQASPVLAAVNDTVFSDFPSPFQFNHAIVAIRLDSSISLPPFPLATVNGWLYFDPTNTANSLGELPIQLHGAHVLRISEADYELTTLPPISPDQYLRRYHADAELGDDNSLSARITITDYGRRATAARYFMKIEPVQDQIKKYGERLKEVLQNPRISEYKSEFDDDSCWVTFLLQGDNYALSSGDLTMLKIDFLNTEGEIEKTRRQRHHPFSFGNPRKNLTEISWRLPAGWRFDGEPDSLDAQCRIAGLKCNSAIIDSILYFNYMVEYKCGSIPAAECEEGFDFLKRLKAAGNTTAMINKK